MTTGQGGASPKQGGTRARGATRPPEGTGERQGRYRYPFLTGCRIAGTSPARPVKPQSEASTGVEDKSMSETTSLITSRMTGDGHVRNL